MSEWLILVLLVPAITVPVVLLVGFVGCHFRPRTAYPPIIDSAIGQGLDAVTVTWHLDPTDPDVSAAQTFFVERTRPNGHVDDPFQIFASPFEDTGLPTSNNVSEVYKYRVGRQLMIDTSPDWSTQVSSPTSLVTFGGPHFLDAGGSIALSPGFCLIQRIEPSQFIYGGPGLNVQIVLHGGSGGGLSIDRIYISQAGGTKPYDAGSDLTPVLTTPLLVNANQVVPIPVVTYSLDHNQPLLIAFDLTPAGPAQVRFLDLPQPPPGPGVTSYLSPAAVAEAGEPDAIRQLPHWPQPARVHRDHRSGGSTFLTGNYESVLEVAVWQRTSLMTRRTRVSSKTAAMHRHAGISNAPTARFFAPPTARGNIKPTSPI